MRQRSETSGGADDVRIGPAVTVYLQARRLDLAPLTLRGHRYTLDAFTEWVGPDTAIKMVTRDDVVGWLNSLDCGAATIRQRLARVRSFFTWAVNTKRCRHNPAAGVKAPRVAVGMPRELERVEVEKLHRSVPDARAELVVSLMAIEMLRRAEVTRLEIGDLDLSNRVMLIHGKNKQERWLPISHETTAIMRAYLAQYPATSGPLIRSYLDGRSGITAEHLGRIVSQWMRDAGIKHAARDGKSGHALRHTGAGAMLDDGADPRFVQQALGHQSLGTTWVYLKRRQAVGQVREYLDDRTYR